MKRPHFTGAASSDAGRFYLGKFIDGRAEPTFEKGDVFYAAAAAEACAASNTAQPHLEIPAVYEFAEMARRYHDAAASHLSAKGRWEQFTTGHPSDDPGHEWHSQQVAYTRNTLNLAEVEYLRAFEALNTAQGRNPTTLRRAA